MHLQILINHSYKLQNKIIKVFRKYNTTNNTYIFQNVNFKRSGTYVFKFKPKYLTFCNYYLKQSILMRF